MLIIPAVDIKNGKCVRLTQGKPETAIVYQDNPIKAALYWQEKGARYLHIVDLDGAFNGKTVNSDLIKEMLSALHISAEIGGGIRTQEDIENYLQAGADRIVLGTQAVTEDGFLEKAVAVFGDKIAVAIDASGGKVAIEGWTKTTDTSILDLASKVQNIGVKTIIYTDTRTDGTLKGPNFKGIEEFIKTVRINVIISGGISTISDIQRIKALEPEGIIIGKALYTGKIKPEELWNG